MCEQPLSRIGLWEYLSSVLTAGFAYVSADCKLGFNWRLIPRQGQATTLPLPV